MPDNKNIHVDHRKRMKAKFLDRGLEGFAPHEVFEMLLFYALPRQDTNPIGHRLIERFGSFSKACDADISELCKISGISEHGAILIKMIPELSRAYVKSSNEEKKTLDGYKAAGEYVARQFIGVSDERFIAVFLDSATKVIETVTINEGDISSVNVNIKKLASLALLKKASSVIVAHNHPDGNIIPSESDLNVTGTIRSALKVFDIPLVEHFVVSGERYMGIINMRSSLEK